jgi:hypothetical protein
MSNPYQSPQNPALDPKYFQDAPQLAYGSGEYGWIQQVRVYAILSAVQGLLELPMGAMVLGMGFFIPAMMALDKSNPKGGGNPPPDEFIYGMMGAYIAIGSVVLFSALLRLFAAYRNFYFKGRTLGIASMIVGLGPLLTCYCGPTAIGVLVYGLIVYLNPAVRMAFAMGEQGRTAAEIFAAFTPYRTAPYAPPPGPPTGP